MAPENVSPLVVWLGSPESRDVTGRVFEVEGGIVGVADGWQHGPGVDKGERWAPAELGPVVRDLIEKAPTPTPVYGAGGQGHGTATRSADDLGAGTPPRG
jgi:hypothetical protein